MPMLVPRSRTMEVPPWRVICTPDAVACRLDRAVALLAHCWRRRASQMARRCGLLRGEPGCRRHGEPSRGSYHGDGEAASLPTGDMPAGAEISGRYLGDLMPESDDSSPDGDRMRAARGARAQSGHMPSAAPLGDSSPRTGDLPATATQVAVRAAELRPLLAGVSDCDRSDRWRCTGRTERSHSLMAHQ